MEHRYDPRIHAQNPVRIHLNGGTIVTGVTRTISYGDLALKSSQTQCLTKNAVVRVAFVANGALVMFPSQVVRVGNNEAAFMFTAHESARKQPLAKWLSAAA